MLSSRPSLFIFLPITAALLLGCGDSTDNPPGSGGSGGSGGEAGAGGSGGQGGSSAAPIPLEALTDTISKTYCDALFRCCNDQDAVFAFSKYANLPEIKDKSNTLPPAKTFANAAECAANLKPLLDFIPFGEYVAQTNAGNLTYDPAAAAQCRDALEKAACGVDLARALEDPTCFDLLPIGYNAPRSMFKGTKAVGEPCTEIRDGTLNRERGTCDASQAFCCVDNGAGGCAYLPINTNDPPQEGTCKAASDVGESCVVVPDAHVCKLGLACNPHLEVCAAPKDLPPRKNGEPCFDNMLNHEATGACQEGYCDDLGSGSCVPFKAVGDPCNFEHECSTHRCENAACVTFCAGM